MRDLKRNRQTISYQEYVKDEERVVDGVYTGERTMTFGTVKSMDINISPKNGNAKIQPFGLDLDYDLTAVTCDTSCPLNEKSRVWIGRSTSLPHNYVITKVSKSLNSITYALKECD